VGSLTAAVAVIVVAFVQAASQKFLLEFNNVLLKKQG